MLNGYPFRLYSSPAQAQILLQWIGYQRVIYNAKVDYAHQTSHVLIVHNAYDFYVFQALRIPHTTQRPQAKQDANGQPNAGLHCRSRLWMVIWDFSAVGRCCGSPGRSPEYTA
ncbi:MAG: hypothetical protein C7B46_12835 [Sulfobacillus benefaciens]|uniref:Transposase putative helix-turn-helix domain-containing protein n=1 Tax=Sulfobacillus benefaciens TaxID=453960 RepID=A0A2T2XE66_9FIRM|nr:MAG: hypothetical protein C7B46_12835 [Sulfobacillus benefaciens]